MILVATIGQTSGRVPTDIPSWSGAIEHITKSVPVPNGSQVWAKKKRKTRPKRTTDKKFRLKPSIACRLDERVAP